jgi:hypothetical protein
MKGGPVVQDGSISLASFDPLCTGDRSAADVTSYSERKNCTTARGNFSIVLC